MKLHIRYTAQMRTAIGKCEEEVELPDGSNLAALLGNLVERLGPQAAAHLVSDTGEAQPGLLIVVNDLAVASYRSLTTELRAGDVVTLLPPIAGG